MENNAILRLEHVSKLYGANKADAMRLLEQGASKDEVKQKTGVTVALWDINCEVRRGEILVIIGLSGSGKSTLVRCLNLLHRPSSGEIWFEDSNIGLLNKNELLDFRRKQISMVFQSFALMNHRNVIGNVAFGLEIRGVPTIEREKKAMEIIRMVGLEGWERQPVTSLSGGMRQRVGLARALANDPEILLMDEAFSALDPLVRSDMQFELMRIQRRLGKTIVFITHDMDEAFKLGDRVAIMQDGRLIQIDTPEEMSTHPATEYVRRFIGSADRSKVLKASNIMVTPDCLVRLNESPLQAVKEMRRAGVSSAFVLGDKMDLVGLLTVDAAIEGIREQTGIAEKMLTDLPTTCPDTLVSDILPIATETRFPISVISKDGSFEGIVTKASVLSCFVEVEEKEISENSDHKEEK